MVGAPVFDDRGLDELETRLRKAASFDFRSRGTEGESVGLEARLAAGAALHDRFLAAKGPNNRKWPRLNPAYRAWKARNGYPTRIGVLTGESSVERQFLGGKTTIEPHRVTFVYGTTARSQKVMGHFHRGTARQPKRPFFAMDRKSTTAVRKAIREAYRQHLRRAIRGEGR
ncbi:hypothetical protein AB1L88_15740 [Tautonia sp. JC769]|uniref:hypothetical protein n=1 Tax=Tautonia sp. JC769 TaxID=3232135 RepID=UPI003459CA0F